MSSLNSTGYWVVVPAAGVGRRMGATTPKQYLPLNGTTLLEQTLFRLLELPLLKGLVLVVGSEDTFWQSLNVVRDSRVETVVGGKDRCDSVLNGLRVLENRLSSTDWVMVHDAARPCVALSDIENLISELEDHLVGGILGVPASDTLKRLNDNYGIEETVDRQVIWQAQTPQMFRYGVLLSSLERALQAEADITDEASAVEYNGYVPLMVEGRRDNIKVTRPEDLPMAELILQSLYRTGELQ